MDKLQWAKWFVEHGFAIFPIDAETKKPVIKEWQKHSTTPLSDEEKAKYLEMVEKGYNYAIPGGQKGLVILDFEDKELVKAWIGEFALNDLCNKTLCVNTPHGGIHVYVISDDIPPQKFNPVFVKENKGIADLQSYNSYVVGVGSCINHKYCESDKCPWKGQDYTTCYIHINNNNMINIEKIDLKGLLKFLAEKGKKLGIELSSSAHAWVYGEKIKESSLADLNKLKKEMLKYDKFKGKSIDKIREEICKKIKEKLETVQSEKAKQTLQIARGVICEGKSYADVGIDRSRGDWRIILYLMRRGVTDPDKILKLLPKDSKAIENEKWDTKKYFHFTLNNAWIIVNLEKIQKELKKYDNGKSIEKIKEEICNKKANKLIKGVVCEGKNYADIGIDKTKGDWNIILFLMRHGVTDVNKILKLLPSDSKARENKTLDDKKYLLDTLKDAWSIAKKYIQLKKNLISAENVSEIKAEVQEVISDIILHKYNIKTFYRINNEKDAIIGIFIWNEKHGVYEPFESRLRKLIRKEIETIKSSLVVDSVREKKKIKMVKVLKNVVDSIVDEIRDKTLTQLVDDPLRIAFKNGTLEWNEKGITWYDLKERTPKAYAFHYIDWKLRIEEIEQFVNKEITIEDIEQLARRVCPKSLEAFKQWVDDKWILLFEVIGYTLYPKYVFNKAVLLTGSGSNGKSTFLNLLLKILGRNNVSAVSLKRIVEGDKFASIELYHKLANISSELFQFRVTNTDLFKKLTGEDYVEGQKKFKDPIYFINYAKLINATNELPVVKDQTYGFWRRWIVIEFPHQFEEDPGFFDKTFTNEEIEGVITVSIIAFARVMQRRKFDFEDSSANIKEKWERASDSVYAFVKDLIENNRAEYDPRNGDLFTPIKEFYQVYVNWCEENDRKPEAQSTVTKRLEAKFRITKDRKKIAGERVWCYVGIRLKKDDENSTVGIRGNNDTPDNLLELYYKQYSGTVWSRKDLQDELGLRAYELLNWCEKRNMCHWIDEEHVRFD